MKKELKMKRVYEEAERDDGYRILVDRIWPRGVAKEKAAIDEWYKEITPSTKIRKAFDHKPERFDTFKQEYIAELDQNKETDAFIKKVSQQLSKETVTFVYAAKDEEHNHVVILIDYVKEKMKD